MNVRVCLLALVTVAFMAIWDADRPVAGRAGVAQSRFQNADVSFANSLSISDCPPLVAAKHSHASPDDAAASESASATANYKGLIPLLKNLQPGTWQAITHDGDTFRITIECYRSLRDATYIDSLGSEGPGKRLCVITAPDGTRWCFIKEHSKTAQQPGSVQR